MDFFEPPRMAIGELQPMPLRDHGLEIHSEGEL